MFNPTELTPEKIKMLAEKMRDPELRKKAAFELASRLGPSPDESMQMAQLMGPDGPGVIPTAPEQAQLPYGYPPDGKWSSGPPPGEQPAMTPEEEQRQAQDAQQQTQRIYDDARMYDQLGLSGAEPDDDWGKAAIYQEFLQKQELLMQLQQQQQMQQQQPAPQGGTPQPPPSLPRQQDPNENYDAFIGRPQKWSF